MKVFLSCLGITGDHPADWRPLDPSQETTLLSGPEGQLLEGQLCHEFECMAQLKRYDEVTASTPDLAHEQPSPRAAYLSTRTTASDLLRSASMQPQDSLISSACGSPSFEAKDTQPGPPSCHVHNSALGSLVYGSDNYSGVETSAWSMKLFDSLTDHVSHTGLHEAEGAALFDFYIG